MPPESTNPYAPPNTEEPLAFEPPAESGIRSPLPPYTPLRLFLAFALITVGWLIFWAEANSIFSLGALLIAAVPTAFNLYAKVTNPHSQRTDQNFKWYHLIPMVAGLAIFMIFLWTDVKMPPPVKAALMHPATFVLGGSIFYGLLIRDWWKRRNNPPCQPEPEVDPVAFSRWKRMRRLGIRE